MDLRKKSASWLLLSRCAPYILTCPTGIIPVIPKDSPRYHKRELIYRFGRVCVRACVFAFLVLNPFRALVFVAAISRTTNMFFRTVLRQVYDVCTASDDPRRFGPHMLFSTIAARLDAEMRVSVRSCALDVPAEFR